MDEKDEIDLEWNLKKTEMEEAPSAGSRFSVGAKITMEVIV
jgi:hypothetical protein